VRRERGEERERCTERDRGREMERDVKRWMERG